MDKKKNKSLPRKQYYIYGKHPVFAALQNKNRKILKVFTIPKYAKLIETNFPDVNFNIVSPNEINQKIDSDNTHQGIIALTETIYQDKITKLDLDQDQDRVVILDRVVDSHNIGAIMRSATAFGINKLIITEKHAPDENATIAKTSSGSLELIQIIRIPNLQQAITHLKKHGFWIVGMDLNGTNNLAELVNIDKLGIIIGSESQGMRELTKNSCDFLTKIPISQKVESLNASNAAAIIFYATQII